MIEVPDERTPDALQRISRISNIAEGHGLAESPGDYRETRARHAVAETISRRRVGGIELLYLSPVAGAP